MLPYFPKSHKEMCEIFNAQIFDAMFSVSPILSQIGVRAQREGRKSSFQDEQGNVRQIDYKLISVPIERKLDEARGMSMDNFLAVAREGGIGMGIHLGSPALPRSCGPGNPLIFSAPTPGLRQKRAANPTTGLDSFASCSPEGKGRSTRFSAPNWRRTITVPPALSRSTSAGPPSACRRVSS
jgi:hypothetical protein